MDNMKHRRLQELDRSDFEIVKGEPDIRGWDVRNAEGKIIGDVEELIVDAQMKKVRYMVVELDDDELDLDDGKRVLIPIGLAEVDKDDDDVILPTLSVEQLKALPEYDVNNLDDEAERKICTILGRQESTAGTSGSFGIADTADTATKPSTESPALGTPDYYANFYQHAYFNDDNLYKNRQHEARPEQSKQDPEYEHGLRLWELRSEGGVIPGDANPDAGRDREISDERRREMIHDRRRSYEERRGPRGKKDKTIIQRIKDEGLQDGGR